MTAFTGMPPVQRFSLLRLTQSQEANCEQDQPLAKPTHLRCPNDILVLILWQIALFTFTHSSSTSSILSIPILAKQASSAQTSAKCLRKPCQSFIFEGV